MTTIAVDARKLRDFGIGTYLRGLLSGIAALDRETRYILLGEPEPGGELASLPANFTWRSERSPGYSLRELWRLSRAVRRAGADLFHSPHYVLPWGLACPAVVTVHDLIHLRFPEHRTALEKLYARIMLRRAVKTAARTLAVSEATRDELREEFGPLAARVVTIPNGVDDRYRQPLLADELRARLARFGLASGYLLFVGNPKPHKNLALLLAAHERLKSQRGARAPGLVLAGSDSAPTGHAGVLALGVVAEDDLRALYGGASAVVVPSLWEGFGLPAAEAMACGTPVVASDRGALPEVVADAGLLFDPSDIEALVRQIERLLDEPSLRAELVRRGRERAGRYRWVETARSTLSVYRDVLSGVGEAAP